MMVDHPALETGEAEAAVLAWSEMDKAFPSNSTSKLIWTTTAQPTQDFTKALWIINNIIGPCHKTAMAMPIIQCTP